MAEWTLDPAHTAVEFSTRHMMVTTVRGQFQKVSGTLNFDPQNPAASSIEVTIDAASLTTTVEDRDNHLRSPDFLDVASYPTITFKSTKVEMTGSNTGKITGNLTIHGVTRPVVIDAEYLGEGKTPYGKTVTGFTGTTRINREDWGLTWNVALETGGWLVGKELTIRLDAEAIKVEPAAV
jgi:polyisoprenoid-binding protein YceI